MIDARVRLIYNVSMNDEEKRACRKGAETLGRFQVKVEEAIAGPDAGKLIRNGPLVSIMAGGNGLFTLGESMFRPFRFSLTDTDTRMLTVGITPHAMDDGERRRFVVGKALAGAVVSLADLRRAEGGAYRGLDAQTYLDALGKLTEHAMGLALIQRGSCGNPSCIMQEASDIIGFVAKIARLRLDFCGECQERIRSTVTNIMYFAMA
ncbi:MAG: hypothetical protein AB1324_06215 [Candidatus Micrarchaeota archaeon]